MVDLAGFIARPSTCTAHHEICNIVMAMCILSNLYLNVKITEKLKTQNEISGSGKLFFDFRGMYMALLVFDNQEYCTLIDIFLRQEEIKKEGDNRNIWGSKRSWKFMF